MAVLSFLREREEDPVYVPQSQMFFLKFRKEKWKECLKIAKLLKKLQESFDFTGREA